MNVRLRRDKMVQTINEMGTVSFQKLKTCFTGVSDMTLRRDLEALDNERRIIRIHGGAKSVDVVIGTDDLFDRRAVRNAENKRCIAEKALQFIKPNVSIYIDSGTTTTTLASLIPDGPYLLFTNSITCVAELIRLKQAEINLLGGRVNTFSRSTNGTRAISYLENVNFDIAIMSTTGYISGRGFSCGVEEENLLKREVIRRSEKVIMLMDSLKVGFTCTFTTAALRDVNILVSDGQLPPAVQAEITKGGVMLL